MALRGYAATFVGAFLLALIYSTKSETGPLITITRSGDTALVLDTAAARRNSVDTPQTGVRTESASSSDSAALAPLNIAGSSSPPVTAGDLAVLKSEGMMIPVAGVAAKDLIDSFDDARSGERHHNALDIMAPRNTPVLAAASGTVLQLHNSVAGGLSIYASDPTSRFVMMYGHLDSYKPGLAKGQAIERGQLIGFVGSTGDASPLAPHLHFQITRNDNLSEWWKGTPINPFLIFRPKG